MRHVLKERTVFLATRTIVQLSARQGPSPMTITLFNLLIAPSALLDTPVLPALVAFCTPSLIVLLVTTALLAQHFQLSTIALLERGTLTLWLALQTAARGAPRDLTALVASLPSLGLVKPATTAPSTLLLPQSSLVPMEPTPR